VSHEGVRLISRGARGRPTAGETAWPVIQRKFCRDGRAEARRLQDKILWARFRSSRFAGELATSPSSRPHGGLVVAPSSGSCLALTVTDIRRDRPRDTSHYTTSWRSPSWRFAHGSPKRIRNW